jgi:hypothetical protein
VTVPTVERGLCDDFAWIEIAGERLDVVDVGPSSTETGARTRQRLM